MTAPTAGSLTAWPSVSNILSLPNGQAKGMGIIGVTSGNPTAIDAKDVKIGPIKITTGTVPNSPNGTGTASLYVFASEDGMLWPYGIDPTSASDQAAIIAAVNATQIVNQRNLIQTINCPISATAYYFDWWSILQRLNAVPSAAAVLIYNATGAALGGAAGGFDAHYRVITFN